MSTNSNHQNASNQGANVNTSKPQKKTNASINLQDVFLNEVRNKRMKIMIYLVNGYKMEGIVKSFDNFTILLVKDGVENLIYKHAVTTVTPSKSLDIQL